MKHPMMTAMALATNSTANFSRSMGGEVTGAYGTTGQAKTQFVGGTTGVEDQAC